MERIKKDEYYLNIAETVTKRSTCLRRRYGAIIVKNDEVISTGYNGAPRGEINCCDYGFCQRDALGIPKGERYELCVSAHAECNAIISAARRDMIDATIYIVGINAKDGTYANPAPCLMCRRMIKNAGITRCIGSVNGVPTEISLDPPAHETEFPNQGAPASDMAPPKDTGAVLPEAPKPKEAKTSVSRPAVQKTSNKKPTLENSRLDGGYVMVNAPASPEMLQAVGIKDNKDTYRVTMAIQEDVMEKYATSIGYYSLAQFMTLYTDREVIDLGNKARRADALAFVYAPNLCGKHYFPYMNLSTNEASLAYIAFLTGIDGESVSAPAAAKKPVPNKDGKKLAGGYIAITTYASYELLAQYDMENEKDAPVVIQAVKHDFLEKYAKENGWDSLDKFLKEYTYDKVEGLENQALYENALAFTYGGSVFDEDPFPYLALGDKDAVLAYTDFLSGLLQDQGHEGASKAIDAMFAL